MYLDYLPEDNEVCEQLISSFPLLFTNSIHFKKYITVEIIRNGVEHKVVFYWDASFRHLHASVYLGYSELLRKGVH